MQEKDVMEGGSEGEGSNIWEIHPGWNHSNNNTEEEDKKNYFYQAKSKVF